jgi:hypothetical protein
MSRHPNIPAADGAAGAITGALIAAAGLAVAFVVAVATGTGIA